MGYSPNDILAVAVTILLCMGFHEAMHAFTAHWLGDPTARDLGRLTLNPFKHIDIYMTLLLPIGLILVGLPPIFIAKPVPFNPMRVRYGEFGAALIGVVGPLTNLFLAIAAAGVLRIIGPFGDMSSYLVLFIQINISFFVFNMIPFPPLDGSRVVFAFAPEPVQRVMYRIESMGFLAIIIFFLLAVQFLGPFIRFANNYFLRILV